jgi:predicted nucleic acid-binding protein
VTLVDTGPFVALFDPKDGQHVRCRKTLKGLRDPLYTTIPVLTEAFYMLSPGSYGASRLRDFLLEGGASVWFMDELALQRAFSLMDRYADHPMDLADASLIAAAEILGIQRVFTLDRGDFSTYRVQRGRGLEALEVLP